MKVLFKKIKRVTVTNDAQMFNLGNQILLNYN